MFSHLHTHSFYSFASGTIPVTDLPRLALEAGMTSLALTDTNNLSGGLEFYLAAKEAGIKPLLGVELKTRTETATLLAKDLKGYKEICDTVTSVLLHIPQAKPKLTVEDALRESFSQDHFSNEYSSHVRSAIERGTKRSRKRLMEDEPEASHVSLLPFLSTLSDRVNILTSTPHLLTRLAKEHLSHLYLELIPGEKHKWKLLREIYKEHKIPIVATNNVQFQTPKEYNFHRLLRAIGTNTNIGTLPPSEVAHPSQYFTTEKEFKQLLGNVSDEAFHNVRKIMMECNVEFDLGKNRFARFPTSNPEELLKTLAEQGFQKRYTDPRSEHYTRFHFELDLIMRLGATSYFLAVHDMLEFAKSKNFPYLGRGSGANSLIAYCLGISNVDPIANNLRFERFLNPERKSAPDFDMDFSWRDRYEVINYMLNKYGRDRAAMLCTVQCYRDRASLREIGKALGYSEEEINYQIYWINQVRYTTSAKSKEEAKKYIKEKTKFKDTKEWLIWASKLHGFPKSLSVHAGGVVIADKPLSYYMPTQMAPIGVPITQQDMFSAEDWGLIKLDILATRGLGTYHDTMNLVEERYGTRPPIEDERIAFNDERTKELIRTGETKGCFYIESPAMIGLLRKLQTDTFQNLTAASSVIRPGVAQSGMMQEFIKRHRNPETATHIHPMLGELMKETYGIMVYQEDVLTVAHEFAGLTYGEADLFRRAMSGKLRSHERMAEMETRFVSGCVKKGIEEAVAKEVWRQVASFAGYSFCKAHSASYAVLSFQEAWLKVYYPAEFMCSILNNFGGYYNHQEYINEAKRLGLTILLPNANKSEYLHTVRDSKTIQLGLVGIKDVSQETIHKILDARRAGGCFTSIFDFGKRTGISPTEGQLLVSIGACLDFEPIRPHGVNKLGYFFNCKEQKGRKRNPNQQEFDLDTDYFPWDLSNIEEYDPLYIYDLEKKFLGYAVTNHPCDFLDWYETDRVSSKDLMNYTGERVTVVGYVSSTKRTSTRHGEAMLMLNLSDKLGVIDVVVWPRQYKKFYDVISIYSALEITGNVTETYDVITLEALEIKGVEFRTDRIHLKPNGKLERQCDKTNTELLYFAN